MAFRRSLFGYKPRAVDHRIGQFEARLRAADERIAAAAASESSLRVRIVELESEVERLRGQRMLVAERLLAAEEEAQAIRETALKDVNELRRRWQAEFKESQEQLQLLRSRIEELRRSFVHLLTASLASDGDDESVTAASDTQEPESSDAFVPSREMGA